MRHRYDLAVTRYICDRARCKTTLDVPSDTFYEFAGPNDPAFWCPSCEDLPMARPVGVPATDLPVQLPLLNGFTMHSVPRLEPSDDPSAANLIYRPYSQRSFLRQYVDWLVLKNVDHACHLASSASCFKRFDTNLQRYTDEIDYELIDQCDDGACQFLRTETLKPITDDQIHCSTLQMLLRTQTPYGLCQTKDESNILRNYLLISGGDHFPMMIPQPSILSGQKRPDFICFIPLTTFQYQPVAVLIDRPGKLCEDIDAENSIYEDQGYRVKRILVDWDSGFSYFKAARELKNWVESQ